MITIENILIISDNNVANKINACKVSEIKPLMNLVEYQSGVNFKKNFNRAKNQLIHIIKYN